MIAETMERAQVSLTRDEIQQRVRVLGKWFHNMNLRGVWTAPDHFLGDYPHIKFRNFAHAIPGDLRGMTVLDIGCNAGFYSIEMKRRGAERVVAIDFDEQYLAQAKFAAQVLNVDIEFHPLSVYDVAKLSEKFDVVIFMGVLYHLRHPLLALDLIREHVAKDLFVFQSLQRGSNEVELLEADYPFEQRDIFDRPGYPKMHFIEKKYCGDPTNWWAPNRACSEAMLRSAGFTIEEHPEEEVYICHRAPLEESGAVYPAKAA
jgi:tRNA (mo5U34)-methyltransferase